MIRRLARDVLAMGLDDRRIGIVLSSRRSIGRRPRRAAQAEEAWSGPVGTGNDLGDVE